jgi:class 3 adenylate cyclase/tetratricopeptide (TPR) repeat protein
MRFCGHCGAAAADAPAQQVADTLRSFVAQPVAKRLVETGGELPEERRLITALFADISGFTSLADRLDPEELLEVIDPVISGLSSIVGRYEGYVEKFAGDALLALFGAPVSHEDDAERALVVALEMHRELERICKELPHDADLTLHCGVNSGHGIARILGSEARMDYAVLGDSVILAQRLESAAPKGETYVSDFTYRLTADRFDFEPVGELTLKGKTEAVQAWRLVGARASPLAKRRTTVLIGRESELETLTSVFERALEGWGGLVILTGEPGVGKSRLTEAARALATEHGLEWLQTRCLSYGAGLPYWPYAELLRSAAGIEPQAAAEEAGHSLRRMVRLEGALPYFSHLLGLPSKIDIDADGLEPEAFRRGLHDAFASWLADRAAERPIVLVLEDGHWADPSSLELTRELGRLCEKHPLVMFVTARPEVESALEDVLPGARALRLEPLDEVGIGQLVQHVLEGRPPSGLVRWVIERTTGNPYFVEELVRSLREHQILQLVDGRWVLGRGWEEGDVPPTVEGLLASRIDLLPRPAAELLQTASVIGRVIAVPLLAAVRGEDDGLAPFLETLLQRGFLDLLARDEVATVAFHHALVQDVAYSRLLRRQRRDLHRRVADVAETLYGAGDDVVDLLARHLYLGEAGTKAIDYLVRAGERAQRLFANQEAIVHFAHAAEVVERNAQSSDRETEILLSLADLHDLVGEYDEAARFFTKARDATSDVRAWRGLASAHRKRGEYQEALAIVDEAFGAPELAGVDLALLWLERGATLSSEGRFTDAIEVLERGLVESEERRSELAKHLLVPLARAESYAGRYEQALRHALEAQAQSEAAQDLRSQCSTARLLGDIYLTLERLDEAVVVLERGLELALRVGNIEEIGGCLINLGLAKLGQGKFEDAVTCNERAIAEFDRIGHGSGRALAYSNLAWVLANKGDYDDAERYCEQAIELSRSIGHRLVAAETTDTMAFIQLRRGSADEAAKHAEEAARLFLELGASPKAAQSLDLAANAWEAAGDDERAREVRSRARSLV